VIPRTFPELVKEAVCFLPAFISSSMPALCGLSVWAAAPMVDERLISLIQPLANDPAVMTLYSDGQLVQTAVAEQARLAIGLAHSIILALLYARL